MEFKNLKELFDTFSDENVCRKYLAFQRWKNKPVCPYCGHSDKIYQIEKIEGTEHYKRFKCSTKECGKKFSVTVGTIFEDTKIPLSKWFGALYLLTAHKKGISSSQLHRDLSVTQKTAWFMLQRIREMLKESAPELLKNTVEMDETYIGGKEKNKHADKKGKPDKRRLGRSTDTKSVVFGIVERDGKVYAKKIHAPKIKYMYPIIEKVVAPGTTVVTDDWPAYMRLDLKYAHYVINHSKGKYAHGMIHTNTIEGFWSLLKRGILGIYHSVTFKHLDAYCSEFAYRYNTKKISDPLRFQLALSRAEGKRLKYADLTHKFWGTFS